MIFAVFARFSMLQDVVTFHLHTRLYVLYLLVPVALIGGLASGGLRRAFAHRAAFFWLALVGWMIVCIPASTWIGGSIGVVSTYVRSEVIMVLVIATVGVTWQDTQRVINAIALSSLGCVLGARTVMQTVDGRVNLDFGGSIANSNDLAAHLILLSPFLLLIAARSTTFFVIRLAAASLAIYNLNLILAAGSRGALLAVVVIILFLFWRASNAQRLLVLVVVPLLAAGLIYTLPQRTLNRMSSFGGADSDAEAMESSENRSYLLRQSLYFTATHPVFGVGPGQFSTFESENSKSEGRRANWHETHNVFTQISSENGLPGLFCYLGAIISTFGLLNQVRRQAKQRPGCQDMANVALYQMVALVGFCTAIAFLTMGYRFYLPALTGLAIITYNSAQFEFNRRAALLAIPQPHSPGAPPPPTPARRLSLRHAGLPPQSFGK